MELFDRFRRHLALLPIPPGPALVAVSGGPDSVALLDLLVRCRDQHGLSLLVSHLDHGIHPESHAVAERVRELARGYDLRFELGGLGLGPGASETLARSCRQEWLEATRIRLGAGSIFLAHHADDQVETVLMRALAGSGPAGLAGMSAVRGRLIRPLLPFSRAELSRYLTDRGLAAWLDPANQDERHLRSWIRGRALPLLRERLARVDDNLIQLSRHAAQDRAAWDALLDVLPGLDLRVEKPGISVAAPALAGYDSALVHALILAIGRRASCRLSPARVDRVLRLMASETSGARVPLGGNWTAELAFGRLRIHSSDTDTTVEPWVLSGERGEGSWGRWRFLWEPGIAPNRQPRVSDEAWFTPDSLTVRGWSPGEKLKPLGGPGRRLLVRCFQEQRVPRSRRKRWPILAQNGEVVWIPGVCRSDALLPPPGEEAVRVHAEYA